MAGTVFSDPSQRLYGEYGASAAGNGNPNAGHNNTNGCRANTCGKHPARTNRHTCANR